MSEWISIQEAYPEYDKKVLVYFQSGDIETLYLNSGENGGISNSWYPGGRDIGWSSHWMPLPEPPK